MPPPRGKQRSLNALALGGCLGSSLLLLALYLLLSASSGGGGGGGDDASWAWSSGNAGIESRGADAGPGGAAGGGPAHTTSDMALHGGKDRLGGRAEAPAAKLGIVPVPAAELRKVAAALEPEVMAHSPASPDVLMEGMKTACWEHASKPRCLPYVYLAGSFQAGANSLLAKLSMHEDVVTNDMTRWQFWGEEGKAMSEYAEGHGRSLAKLQLKPASKVVLDGSFSTFAFYWSAGLRTHQAFQRAVRPCHHNCSLAAGGGANKLAVCMDTVCFPHAHAADDQVAASVGVPLESLQLPLLLAAAYAGGEPSRLPKMVVLLRDPVARLHCAYWSHPHYKGKYGESAEGELAYLREQIGAMRKCESKGHTMWQCALYFETYTMEEEALFFHADQVIRGMYHIYLEHWMAYLGSGNVLALRSEDFFAEGGSSGGSEPSPVLSRVFDFLGLDRPNGEVWARMHSGGRPQSYVAGRPEMLPEARQLASDFYAPWNAKLAELLGQDFIRGWS